MVRDRNTNGSFDRLFGGKLLGDDPKEFYSRKNQDFITFNSDKYELKKPVPVRLRRTQTTSVKTGLDDGSPLTSEPSSVWQGNDARRAKLQENSNSENWRPQDQERSGFGTDGLSAGPQKQVDALDNFMHETRPDMKVS